MSITKQLGLAGMMCLVVTIAGCAPLQEGDIQVPVSTREVAVEPPSFAATASPSVSADPLQMERANRHTLLFWGASDGDSPHSGTVYRYDYEVGTPSVMFSPEEAEAVARSVYISPNGLHWVFASFGSTADPTESLLEVDLATRSVTRIGLYLNGEWLIPVVDDRRPGEEYENEVLHGPLESSIGQLDRIVWAPDSEAFAFTMGTPGGSIDRHNNSQIYYVQWGTENAVPLATNVPGNNVGLESRWSSGGGYLSFIQQWQEDIWVIDLDEPSSGILVFHDAYSPQLDWLPDGNTLLISDWDFLATCTLPELDTRILLDPPYTPGEFVTYYLMGTVMDGSSVIVLERVEDDQGGFSREDQRVLLVNLSTGVVQTVVEGEPIVSALEFPNEDWLWLLYDDPPGGRIVAVPGGDTVVESSSRLRLPFEELVRRSPVEPYSEGLSPDMQLAALIHNGRLMIWDVLTGEYTEVAPELEGEKTFIGWIPDPDAWEAALAAGAP